MSRPPYVSRMIVEREELMDKYGRLYMYTISREFKDLPAADQRLMEEQVKIMRDYDNVLNRRIERALAAPASPA